MAKGILKDPKTGKYYIHTTINNKTCTIRGYETRRQAEADFYNAVDNWRAKHHASYNPKILQELFDEYIYIREFKNNRRSVAKEIAHYNTHFIAYANLPIGTFFEKCFATKFYDKVLNDKKISEMKRYKVILLLRALLNLAYNRSFISPAEFQTLNSIILLPKYVKNIDTHKRIIPQYEIKAFLDATKTDNIDFICSRFSFIVGRVLASF